MQEKHKKFTKNLRKGIDNAYKICYNICVNARTDGGEIEMFDRDLLLYVLKKNNKSVSDLALQIGKNEATVYRKLRSDGNFTRNEIVLIADLIGWEDVRKIFFASNIA